MPTNKKRVQGYLSDQVYQALDRYALERGISQSTALEQILSGVLLSESIGELSIDSRSELKGELVRQVFAEAEEYIDHRLDLINKRINEFERNLWELKVRGIKGDNYSTELPSQSMSEFLNGLPDDTFTKRPSESDSESDSESLTNAELARILGVNPATSSRWATGKRKPPEDLEWMYNNNLKNWQRKL